MSENNKKTKKGLCVVLDTNFIVYTFTDCTSIGTLDEIRDFFRQISDDNTIRVIVPSVVLAELMGFPNINKDSIYKLFNEGIFEHANFTNYAALNISKIANELEYKSAKKHFKIPKTPNEYLDFSKTWDGYKDDLKIIAVAEEIGADFIATADQGMIKDMNRLNSVGVISVKPINILEEQFAADLNNKQTKFAFDK